MSENGYVVRCDGSGWRGIGGYPGVALNGVWGTAANDVFAVGDGGTIIHFDGKEWHQVEASTTNDLTAVSGSSSSDVFAVGVKGTIVHFDGKQWATTESGTTETLHGVWAASSKGTFAVGDKGVVLHFDGIQWSPMPAPSKDNVLHAVWGSSPTNVHAVGAGATILHYDGEKWARQSSGVAVLGDLDSTPLATFTGIWGMPDGSKVFVVGPDVPSPGMLQYPPWPKTLLDTALADACKLAREQSARSPEARELAAACESAAAPPGASKPFPWHPPSPTTPAPKAVVYVSATNLRLRAKANANADLRAEVPLNTRAEVRSVSGEWAEVEVSVPAARMLGFGPDFKPSGEARRATGWAPWKFMAPNPCTKQDLLRDAALHEKQDDLPEAIRLLDRARALDSDDRAIDAELTRLTGTMRDDTSGVSFLGCRGLRELAAVVDGSTGAKKLAATTTNACVIVSDPLGPCSPPDPYAAAPFSEEEACSPEYRGTTSLAACKRALAAQRHVNDAVTEKWQGEAGVFAAKVHALQALFPSSSTVRFVLGANRRGRVYAYQLPYKLYECQDSGATFDWQHLAISSDGLDLSPASSPVTVWVDVKQPVSAIVGLVEAPDSEQARAKVLAYKEKPLNNSDVAAMLWSIGPRPHVALPAPRCHCEGSPAVAW